VIDNGSDLDQATYAALAPSGLADLRVLAGHGNVGYGAGHNLALPCIESDYHLILNPDVELAPDSLAAALTFFEVHPDIGLIAPLVMGDHGKVDYLCRRYPSVFTLLVRGFFPRRWHAAFAKRLDRYELRDQIDESGELRDKGVGVLEPPIISGCFMLYRTRVLKEIAGFDPRYFLYFEDYDLSLRTTKVTRIAYVPSVRIVHSGGGAARKGGAHIRLPLLFALRMEVVLAEV
jgi:GT2 family glycosyltransferase